MKASILSLVILYLVAASPAAATPPLWETDYGVLVPPADPNDPNSLDGLAGDDDAESEVTLGFSFPFEGVGYTTLFVGTNGCIQVGSLGFDGEIDYDHWEYFEEFYDDDDGIGDPEPVICPFNSDLDNSTDGLVWIHDFGDRAVFTWDEVGTNFNERHHLTFQAQLLADGTIVFGYNGILDGDGESVRASSEGGSLDEGIVIGITLSDGTHPSPAIDFDLNGEPFVAGDTIFERWCYDRPNGCGENEIDLGYSGSANASWDLENQNVVFSPRVGGGFAVASLGSPPASPASSVQGLFVLMLLLSVAALLAIRN